MYSKDAVDAGIVTTTERSDTHKVILFVDDEPLFIACLRRMFDVGNPPWKYQFASTGQEAQSLIDQGGIDVIVLDLQMPDLGGLQLLRNMKANPATADLPVIMLTGKGDEEAAVQCMHSGAADYVLKEAVSQESLEKVILSALERLRLQQQADVYRLQLKQRVQELEEMLARVKMLEGLLPICMYCRRIRMSNNEWKHLDAYVDEYSDVSFSHTLCLDCKTEHYPNLK